MYVIGLELNPRSHKIKLAYLRSCCIIPIIGYASETSYSYIGTHKYCFYLGWTCSCYPEIKKVPLSMALKQFSNIKTSILS